MKRLLLIGILVLALCPSAFAAERPATQKAFRGFVTSVDAGVLVSGSAQTITGITVSCGSTACIVSVYDDGDAIGNANADGVFETGAAANTTVYHDLSNRPIRTASGVSVAGSSAVNAVVIYTEQPTP